MGVVSERFGTITSRNGCGCGCSCHGDCECCEDEVGVIGRLKLNERMPNGESEREFKPGSTRGGVCICRADSGDSLRKNGESVRNGCSKADPSGDGRGQSEESGVGTLRVPSRGTARMGDSGSSLSTGDPPNGDGSRVRYLEAAAGPLRGGGASCDSTGGKRGLARGPVSGIRGLSGDGGRSPSEPDWDG